MSDIQRFQAWEREQQVAALHQAWAQQVPRTKTGVPFLPIWLILTLFGFLTIMVTRFISFVCITGLGRMQWGSYFKNVLLDAWVNTWYLSNWLYLGVSAALAALATVIVTSLLRR